MREVNLKNIDIITLSTALRQLDPVFSRPENPGESPKEIQKFDFDADTIYDLSVTLGNLQDIIDSNLEKTRSVLIGKYNIDVIENQLQSKELDNKKRAELLEKHAIAKRDFTKEYSKILEKTEKVKICSIKRSNLKLDKNKIPISVLSVLIKFVVQE